MEDEPSPPKSNHKEDSNLYKAPCYDWLLIAYSPMDKSYDFFAPYTSKLMRHPMPLLGLIWASISSSSTPRWSNQAI